MINNNAKINQKPLKILNWAVFLQQQRYILPISFIFYLHNGLNLSDFIFFQSIFYAVCLLGEIPGGYIGDIFPRRNVLITAYILFLFRILLWIFFGGYWIVMLGEIFMALSKVLHRGVTDGYIYDYLKSQNMPYEMLKKYGGYNFYMSLGCAISALIGAFLYKMWGFKTLLVIEFFINSSAIILLLFLPNIPHLMVKCTTFVEHTKTVLNTVRITIKNKNINYYIYYSSLLMGVTSLFVWTFQPSMKMACVPVIFFGVLSFINHITRAFSSLWAQKVIDKIPFNRFGFFVWSMYFLSFLAILLNEKILNPQLCLILLVFVCIAIGLQMIFWIATTSEIHKFSTDDIRATASSVNNMLGGFFSWFILLVYKYLIDIITAPKALLIFAMLFVFALYYPIKIFKSMKN